jgi:hypothetical protein
MRAYGQAARAAGRGQIYRILVQLKASALRPRYRTPQQVAKNTWNGSPQRELITNSLSGKCRLVRAWRWKGFVVLGDYGRGKDHSGG